MGLNIWWTKCPKYDYLVCIWYISNMQSGFHFHFIVMMDLSVAGIGLKFRYRLKMLITFLCNCLTSGNSCLHKKILALTSIKESFSSFVKLWNILVQFLIICMRPGNYPQKCLRQRRLIFWKKQNRRYNTDIDAKHIEKACPATSADVHMKGRPSKPTYMTWF